MSRQYQTHNRNFISRFTEEVYTPDKQVIAQLHAMLNMIPDDNIALSIDHCVALLMQMEGYGQPVRHREQYDNHLIGDKK